MVERGIVLVVVVAALAGCGLLNGFTDGDIDSPLAGIFDDDQPDEGEGEDDPGCDNDDDCGTFFCAEGGVCTPCSEDDQCDDGDVCDENSGDCVAPAEGEGEGEGEGECDDDDDCDAGEFCNADSCVVITTDPAVIGTTDDCANALEFEVNDNPNFVGQATIPVGFTAAAPADKHVVVLLADDLGSQASWRGTHDYVCDLYGRGYGVITIARLGESVFPPVNYLEIGVRLLSGPPYNVPADQISFVAASSAAGELHVLLSAPDAPVPEHVVIVSASDDYAPSAQDVVAAGYPAVTHWLAANNDSNCGSATACIDYQADIQNAPGADPSWAFREFNSTAHGVALLQSTDTDVGGSTAHEVIEQLFPPL